MLKKDARVIQVDDINIGKQIATIRQEKGIMQKDMVAMLQVYGLDISIYSYNRVEKGIQNPTVSLLVALCNLLHCDMNTIFDFQQKN